TKALATELCLTTQRLLRDHRVRTSRARVDLVVHQVVELQEVLVTHGNRLWEWLSRAAVEQSRLTRGVDQAVTVTVRQNDRAQVVERLFSQTVEHWRPGRTTRCCACRLQTSVRRGARSSP